MIRINEIPSFRNPDSIEYRFDDRIEKVELINGNAVQDYGHVESGDGFTLTCLFSYENYQQLARLWQNREKVTYTDEAGEIWTDMRLVFKSIKRHQKFPGYVMLTFEMWRV